MKKNLSLLLLTLSLVLPIGCTSDGVADQETTAGTDTAAPTATPDADNTARNANDTTLAETPLDQAENATDLQISAAIRKSVMDDKSLSVNAQNIKIITSNGIVTLRGPVKNDQEKKGIEAKARQVEGVTEIKNLLEVERTP